MAQDVSRSLLSYDDYAAIDDGRRYQVIEGKLIMTPSPRIAHQVVAAELWRLLAEYGRSTGVGRAFIAPVDVVLRAARPAVVVQPDVLFVKRDGPAVVTEANVQGPPDVAIEVLSPSTARLDAVTKHRLYARFGVPEYWLVALESGQVSVHHMAAGGRYDEPTLQGPGDRLTSPLMPGFELDVAALFARASEP